MDKPKIILFTKTRWSEAPRLRHQVVKLIQDAGYEVVFFERPSLFCWYKIWHNDGITFIRHFEPVHHRLRYFPILVKINQKVVEMFIKRTLKKLNLRNVPILNFSYDYFFLRNVFETNIITIIDDDFVNKLSNGLVKNSTENQLRLTAQISTMNLAVSYPLRTQLNQFTDKVGLFFPWAEKPYQRPKISKPRNVALFFGYINYRIDWRIVQGVTEKGIKIRMIGPIEKSISQEGYNQVNKSRFIEFLPKMSINAIDFTDVCCSILPWDVSYEGIQAITINNKCFNLLSYGIPQIYSDLPHLIKADSKVIAKCATVDEFIDKINYFSENFEECQQPIEEFLKQNYAIQRIKVLKKYLKS